MRKVHSANGRFAVILMGIMLALGLSTPVLADACQFWGCISSTPVNDPPPAWYTSELPWLCNESRGNSSNDGFTFLDFHDGTPLILDEFRSNLRIYHPTTGCETYVPAFPTDGPTIVMAHARNRPSWQDNHNPPIPVPPNPHPFVYVHGDNTYHALQHNGTVYNINTSPPNCVEDDFGANFATLDLFYGREFASWNSSELDPLVDTEYYMMMFMKELLIAQNFDWGPDPEVDPSQTHEMLALQATRSLLLARQGTSHYCFNALVSSPEQMWLTHDKWSDGDNHYVSYSTPDANASWMASTTQRGGWSQPSNHRIVVLTPDEATPVPYSMSAPAFLTELRINSRDNSSLSQESPSITSDPLRSGFVATWRNASDGSIQARWYNQMGLAEQDEFVVNADQATDRRHPSIAFHPNGDQIIIAWAERPTGANTFTTVKARQFTWSQASRHWEGETNPNEHVLYTSASDDIDHVSVAMRGDGYGVVWQQYVPSQTQYLIRSHINRESTTYTLTLASTGGNYYEPEVSAFADGTNQRYVFTWGETLLPTQWVGIGTRVVYGNDMTMGTTVNMAGPTTLGNFTGQMCNPSVTVLPYLGLDGSAFFVLAWYNRNGQIYSQRWQVNSTGGFMKSQNFYGETMGLGQDVHTDVACDAGGNPLLVYDKPMGGNDWDVYIVKYPSSGSTMPTPSRLNDVNPSHPTQQRPVISISGSYNCNNEADPYFYSTMSLDDPFYRRLMVVWQSNLQDGSDWGIVGKLNGWNTSTNDFEVFATQDAFDRSGGLLASETTGNEGEQRNNGRLDEVIPGEPETGAASALPMQFALHNAYPNPFNPTTTIRYDLPVVSHVRLEVFDINGRLVRTLVDDTRHAGSYAVFFDATGFSAGMYFMRMETNGYHGSQKLLLLK